VRTVGETGPVAAAVPSVRPAREAERRAFIALVIAGILILWLARTVIGPFVVSAVLAYAFSPLVWAGQQRTGLPRVAIVAIGYLIAIALLATVGYLLAGQAASEFQALVAAGPNAIAVTLRQLIGSDTVTLGSQQIPVEAIAREIQLRVAGLLSSPTEALHLIAVIGETALQAILVLIVTFYFLVDGHHFRDWLVAILPGDHQARTLTILDRIHEVLGKWLRGQLLLIALVAGVVYILLGPILHIPYALAIGVVTGVLEIIPLVGPLIATAIAATDAFASGGASLAGIVVLVFFIVRQVEDQVVMPVVIGRAVHLHPVVTIFAVLVGLSTFGVLGGLLGVPVAAAINVIFHELYGDRGPAGETDMQHVEVDPARGAGEALPPTDAAADRPAGDDVSASE
jgi:predicted PurR-regulated permease PerM